MRGKMRLEKGKMTRKLENHCFFKMSFLRCHFPPLFKSLSLDQKCWFTEFYSRFRLD